MKISALNNKYNTVSFKGDELYKDYKDLNKQFKTALKEKADKEIFDNILEGYKGLKKKAEGQITNKSIPKVFTKVVQWFGKINVEKTGNKTIDTAAKLTKIVLWGNVAKEAVGTTLYTIQALTNEDLKPEKRKFVGMYDFSVGVVSTIFSFIFGVGLEKTIKNGYKGLLKPITESSDLAMKAKGSAAIVGLAAFTSFALQTIVGKRIIAPAIGVPAAGKLRNHLEAKEAEKNAAKEQNKMSPFPAEALVLAKTAK